MNAHWRQRPEGGGRFAIWLIRTIALRCGRPITRVLLYPATLYFFLRRGPERRASRQFLSHVFGHRASVWNVLRHIHSFASIVLDRVFMLTHGERGFALEIEGLEQLHGALDEGRGALLIGSHLGSFEVLRVLSQRYQKSTLRIVLNRQQSPALTALLDALAPDIGKCVIDGSRDPASVVLALGEAVSEGHMVALLADRGRFDEHMLKVPFMGQQAAFPLGPWMLAASLRIPVVLCYGLYLGGNRYKLKFAPFADTRDLPRRGRHAAVQGYVRDFAAHLETQARAYPYNWFNFYDFWQISASDAESDTDPDDDLGARA